MVYSLATQKDGKILIGGDFNGVDGKYRGGFARLNPDGSLDSSFKGGVDGVVRSVAVLPDGKILLGGAFGQCQSFASTALARLNSDGVLDSTFKSSLVGHENSVNQVNHVVPLANGQIMIAGDIYNDLGGSAAARLNSDGSLDADFFANVTQITFPDINWAWGNRVAVVGDKYLVAGGFAPVNEIPYFNFPGFLVRLTNSGTLDTSFAPGAPGANLQTLDGRASDLLVQRDGKIVVSGSFSHVNDGSTSPPARSAIARFSANGLLDDTFVPNLTIPSGSNAMLLAAMAQQPNGKILIENNFFYNDSGNSNYKGSQVARLKPDGSLDPSFTLGTPAGGYFYYDGGNCILRLPHGKALIGGCYNSYNSTPAWGLVRIFAGPPVFNPAGSSELLLTD